MLNDGSAMEAEFQMQLRRTQIIFTAAVAGMFFMMVSMVVLRFVGEIVPYLTGGAATAVILAVTGYAAAVTAADQVMTRWRIGRLRAVPRERRMALYANLLVIRFALIESSLVASLVGWLLTQQDALIALAAAALVYILLRWPTAERVQQELLTADDPG